MRMSLYRYTALNQFDNPRSGYIVASTQQMALSQLILANERVIDLKKESRTKTRIFHVFKVLLKLTSSKKDFVNWWMKELADLLLSGFSLRLALEDTIQKTHDGHYKLLICQIYSDLLSGESFCSALSSVDFFSAEERVILYTAEENHFLIRALQDIYSARMEKIESQSKGSIILFPIILLCVVTIFSSSFLAHNILNIYMYDLWLQNKKTPTMVSFFMSIYSGDGVIKIAFILAAFLFFKILVFIAGIFNLQQWNQFNERMSSYIPIKKVIIRHRYSAHFLSALSPMLNSGAALHAAFYQCSSEISHKKFKKEIISAAQKIYEGDSLSRALQGITFLDEADKLVLQSSLAHYSVDSDSIEHLSRYTLLKLKKLESFLSRISFVTWLLVLILLILFSISSTALLIYIDQSDPNLLIPVENFANMRGYMIFDDQ